MVSSRLPPKPDFDAIAASAPSTADRRTQILALIGNLVSSWSNNESLFIYVLMILQRTSQESAALTFATLNTTRARLDLIQRLAKITIADKDLDKNLSKVIERFNESTVVRNEFNHCMYIVDASGRITHTQSMPLRTSVKTSEVAFHNELNMAGNFAADYTGILCRPGFEHVAIPAFARHLKQMNWARLNLENARISEARYRLLVAHFPKSGFEISQVNRIGKVDGIDNSLCPFATLPPDWNAYLDGLSANTRQKIRRLLKQFESSDEYRITAATSETITRDLDTLLRFWEIKWTPRKGDLVHSLIRSNRAMLTQSFKSDLLYLPTLWKGDRPLAALATFMDRRKRSFLFYMTGRDETFDGLPPGVILHAHSIRYAIENGFTEYDFLRGNESYKYSFGVKERRVRCTVIGTKNGRNIGGRLDRRTVPAALKEATELHKARKLAQAERGYRQILEVDPENADALHRLGQLLTTKGDHAAARRLFKTLTNIRPDVYKAWLCLAQSCEALSQDLDAANAYRQVVKLQPNLSDGFSGLGRMLNKLDRVAQFDAAMDLVLDGDRQSTERNGRPPGRRAVGAALASTLSH